MSNFIAEASAELEHVVWPTPTENKKYMMYTIGVIVTLGIFLAVLGYAISNGLSLTRAQFPHDNTATTPTVSGEDAMTQAELDKLLKNITVNTGTVTPNNSGTTSASGSR
jgi:preprotein translocase SecE subunit